MSEQPREAPGTLPNGTTNGSLPPGTMLSGPAVALDALTEAHREPLRSLADRDQSIWTYFPIGYCGAGDDFDPWFDRALAHARAGTQLPFAVVRKADGCVVGTTRFYEIVPEHRRLAIGSTWYGPDTRGTLTNFEVRLLQLTLAFERWGMNRIELITDPLNMASRAAMKLLGAVEEGRLRNHLIYKDGRIRDSIVFSIIANEWPVVRSRLLRKLGYEGLWAPSPLDHDGNVDGNGPNLD